MATVEVDGRTIEVSHGDRVIFPDAGLTKADLVDHHLRIADHLLPHLRDRPLVMHRFPDGLDGDPFFQKQAPDHFPDWIRTTTVARRSGGEVDHVVCDDAATLAYVANQGAFELHTLLTPADRPDHPDRLVLDLDPSTDDVGSVVAAARVVREVLDDLDLPSAVASTGSRGVHAHIPLDGSTPIDDVHDVARSLAQRVATCDEDLLTVETSKQARGDRVFVDWLRNGYGQHAVAPFSVRARPGAPLAVPMGWDEVTSSSFDPQRVTVANVFRRLAQKDDPWAGFGAQPIEVADLRSRLEG